MAYEIIKYGELSDEQKSEAVGLFLAGFGHFMRFSKDEDLKRKFFIEIFDPELFMCYVEEGKVLGLMGLGTKDKRPVDFKLDACRKYFGERKGKIINRQMNAIFQSQAVKTDKELYLDTLVTDPAVRSKGIGSALIEKACGYGDYDSFITEVFSKNEAAIRFYEKNGFITIKKERFSILRLQGAGYPIKMRKKLG